MLKLMDILNEGIAETIYKQIPRKDLWYVGAREFVGGKDFLQFRVKGSKLKKGGKIVVRYNRGRDTYTVEGWVIRMGKKPIMKKVESLDDIYADQLGDTIIGIVG